MRYGLLVVGTIILIVGIFLMLQPITSEIGGEIDIPLYGKAKLSAGETVYPYSRLGQFFVFVGLGVSILGGIILSLTDSGSKKEEIEALIQCPQCHHYVNRTSKFCEYCGKALKE